MSTTGVERSGASVPSKPNAEAGSNPSAGEGVHVDVRRTWWYDDFFDRFPGLDPEQVIRMVSEAPADAGIPGDATGHPLSEAGYWDLFVRGYAAYRLTGNVAATDPYVRYLIDYFGPRRYDPGLSSLLVDAGQTRFRVGLRYAVMECLARASGLLDVPPEVPLVEVLATRNQDHEDYVAHLLGDDDPILVRRLDGYHRLFAARFYGFRAFPCRLSWTDDEGPRPWSPPDGPTS